MTLIIKKVGESKKGAFTDRAFSANDVVVKLHGESLTAEQVSKLGATQQGDVLQIGTNNYLNLEKSSLFFINHHCNPNCYVKAIVNSAFLIALRPIAKGDEITMDYSLTSTDSKEDWSMTCNCHRFQCRNQISGFNTLSDKKKEEFNKKGIVPRYIKG